MSTSEPMNMAAFWAAESERSFQAWVQEAAEKLGWNYYHTHNSQRSPSGFPDCVLVRGDQLIFAELKTEKGKLRPAQVRWLDDIRRVAYQAGGTVRVFVWHPSDRDRVIEVLTGVRITVEAAG